MFSKLRPFLWQEIQLDAKVRKIVGLRVKFYHFLYVTLQI